MKGVHGIIVLRVGDSRGCEASSSGAEPSRLARMLHRVPRNAGVPLTVLTLQKTGVASSLGPSSSPSYIDLSSSSSEQIQFYADAGLLPRDLPSDGRFRGATCVSVQLLARSEPPRGIVRKLSAAPVDLLVRGMKRMADDHPRYRNAKRALLDWEAHLDRLPHPHNPSRVVWDWMLVAHGVPVLQRFNLALAAMTELFAGTSANIANMVSWIDRGPSIAPEFTHSDHSRKIAKRRGYTFPLTEDEADSANDDGDPLTEGDDDDENEDNDEGIDDGGRCQPRSDWNSPSTLSRLRAALKSLALPQPSSSHIDDHGAPMPGLFTLSYASAALQSSPLLQWGHGNTSERGDNAEFMSSLRKAYLNIRACLEREDHSGAINVLLQARFSALSRILPKVLWGPRGAVDAGKDWIMRLSRRLYEQEQQREREALRRLEDAAASQLLLYDMSNEMQQRQRSRGKSLKRSRGVSPYNGAEGGGDDKMVDADDDKVVFPEESEATSDPSGPIKRIRLMDPEVETFLNNVDAENRAFEALLAAEANEGFLDFDGEV